MKLSSLVLAALISSIGLSAHAAGRLDKIKSTKTISLGHRDSSIPFSYLDGGKPIGYSKDICDGIVKALEKQLGTKLTVKQVPVTSASRIPLIMNGTIDLACGSATNNAERQKQVSFAPTTFVTATRFVSAKADNIKDVAGFKGQTVTSTAGTSNIKWLAATNAKENLGMNIIPSKDHAGAFLTVQAGRAKAFFMDDVLLASLVANSEDPDKWVISDKALTTEPYAMIEPKDDPEFKKAVDDAVIAMIKSGEIEKLYKKWFESPIPPKNINMNLPMSEALKKALANPTDSPDPATYQ
ncbi:MAG TPA: amino acid ABC transporter substrate-binding protein [Advenella sp.]|nr:amino acid ABC transporter substrate-binding protein [Advenella sp.]